MALSLNLGWVVVGFLWPGAIKRKEKRNRKRANGRPIISI